MNMERSWPRRTQNVCSGGISGTKLRLSGCDTFTFTAVEFPILLPCFPGKSLRKSAFITSATCRSRIMTYGSGSPSIIRFTLSRKNWPITAGLPRAQMQAPHRRRGFDGQISNSLKFIVGSLMTFLTDCLLKRSWRILLIKALPIRMNWSLNVCSYYSNQYSVGLFHNLRELKCSCAC